MIPQQQASEVPRILLLEISGLWIELVLWYVGDDYVC